MTSRPTGRKNLTDPSEKKARKRNTSSRPPTNPSNVKTNKKTGEAVGKKPPPVASETGTCKKKPSKKWRAVTGVTQNPQRWLAPRKPFKTIGDYHAFHREELQQLKDALSNEKEKELCLMYRLASNASYCASTLIELSRPGAAQDTHTFIDAVIQLETTSPELADLFEQVMPTRLPTNLGIAFGLDAGFSALHVAYEFSMTIYYTRPPKPVSGERWRQWAAHPEAESQLIAWGDLFMKGLRGEFPPEEIWPTARSLWRDWRSLYYTILGEQSEATGVDLADQPRLVDPVQQKKRPGHVQYQILKVMLQLGATSLDAVTRLPTKQLPTGEQLAAQSRMGYTGDFKGRLSKMSDCGWIDNARQV